MESLARRLAREIARTMNYESEKEAVIAYGMIAIVQTVVTVLIVFLIAILIGAPIEAMILCFSVSLLRRYTGGAHAESIELCTAISVIYCSVFSWFSKFVIGPIISWYLLLLVSAGLYLVALYLIYRRVPVDSPNKPIRTEKKRKRMRKGSYITLSVYIAASFLILMFGIQHKRLFSFELSLLFGVAWQVFTLTALGNKTLGKLNYAYQAIIKKKGGVST